jgi:hypothetical protein
MCNPTPGTPPGRSRAVTVAQLVHAANGRAPQTRHAPFHTLRRAASRRWSCNATLWRAIGTGVGFALIGLTMMLLAIGAAGVAPAAQAPRGDGLGLAQPAQAQRPELYRGPGDPWISTMPVP